MSLSIISPSNLEKENQSLYSIFDSIAKNQSMIFNSGAGAGKTYALIESLKYVISKYGKKLKEHNQKIICITYTNVATEEIKERLGNTELVLISTIHERIWGLIKGYKKELMQIHKEKLNEDISSFEKMLEENHKYQELGSEEKERFIKLMLDNKDLFHQNYSESAKEFRNIFQLILEGFHGMLSNVADFKKIVSIIYKIDDYARCCESIELKKSEYKRVVYNPAFNRDSLHKMRISHDTLLEYGLKIIENYDLLKQIIIDKYPYVFIDEYQDTDEKVVVTMNYLQNYAKVISHNFFIGYFGDTAQNIYTKGVGRYITELHSNLIPIDKEFNRRSTIEIIELINRIRNDGYKQVSIYDDCAGGNVGFYTGNQNDINNFVNKYKIKWRINEVNRMHCFVLTNETVAKYSGFENIYNTFKQTKKYSGINFEQLNTELLSNDQLKLGEIPSLIFKIVKLKNNLNSGQTPIINILQKSIYEGMNVSDIRRLIKTLKKNEGMTLGEYIKSISLSYLIEKGGEYKELINSVFDFEKVSFELFKEHLINKLFPNILEGEQEIANETINKVLDINLSEYESWYKYILNIHNGEIVYHTYHGTKGLEFENVIIIMGNSFGRINDYFKFFFENYSDSQTLVDSKKDKFEQIKNLLYVSCSRAIKNLRILYIDDITDFKSNIEKIFGQIDQFNNAEKDLFV